MAGTPADAPPPGQVGVTEAPQACAGEGAAFLVVQGPGDAPFAAPDDEDGITAGDWTSARLSPWIADRSFAVFEAGWGLGPLGCEVDRAAPWVVSHDWREAPALAEAVYEALAADGLSETVRVGFAAERVMCPLVECGW